MAALQARAGEAAEAASIAPRDVYVIDGDTIRAGGLTYRLVGFDAPETGDRAECQAEINRGRPFAGGSPRLSARCGGVTQSTPVQLLLFVYAQMTTGRTTALLWTAFAIVSALVFAIGSAEQALDMQGVWFAAGSLSALLAGMLSWRHGVSLVMPAIIAVYAIANKWLLFYLFLAVIFLPKAAP